MPVLMSLQQRLHQALVQRRWARYYARMAKARAIRTTREVQRAVHQARMACLARSMPEANPFTLEIAATILMGHGLLDDKPPPGRPRGHLAIHLVDTAGDGLALMTTRDFGEHGSGLINQLLAHGFERPITLAAIASDGLTITGSSETITGTVLGEVKTTAPPGAFARYLLPIHFLFVDVLGRVAYGLIDQSGTASVRLLP